MDRDRSGAEGWPSLIKPLHRDVHRGEHRWPTSSGRRDRGLPGRGPHVPAAGGVQGGHLVAGPFLYDEADEDYQGFWARQAADLLDWYEEWHTILDWELPFAKWFVGGKLNVCHNAVDRHVLAGHGDKVAYHWEGEPGDTRTITYADLHATCSGSPTS